VILADSAAFLDPPISKIPARAAPELATQRELLALAENYAAVTTSKLPNFFATRVTTRFEDTPKRQLVDTTFIPQQPLHVVNLSSVTVLYRDGREVVASGSAKDKKSVAAQGLTTTGVFGPVLGTVLGDAAHGKLAWSHWEQSGNLPTAVFRYTVPRRESHYEVTFCCVPGPEGDRAFRQLSGYHGEIGIDPATGTVLRLTLEADLQSADQIAKADILVEYGPEELGGETYICPVRSVSISRVPTQSVYNSETRWYNGRLVLHDEPVPQENQNAPSPLRTFLNDVVFEQYHLFRADMRMISGKDAEPEGKSPSSVPASASSAPSKVPQQ
jgi:hypothetical protein